ncbi:MAG TPA: SH3 domain-containing protein [Candidatus Sulfomarinibacteraceae bacterium]|nr:SH3 domain-containing protein [Candidatus Sulfomarinibacteraceae bacterium]
MGPYLNKLRSRSTTMLLGAVLLLTLLLAAAGSVYAQDSPWNAWYWNNPDLSGEPALHRLEGQAGLDIGFSAPASGINADNFSARWVNTVQVDSAGSYTFWARVDDGVRVWVNDTLIIDDWEAQAEHTVSASTTLSEGTHVVRVEYFDARDVALLEFQWGPTGTITPGDVDQGDQGDEPPEGAVDDGDDEFSADVVTATTTVNLNIREEPSLQGERLTTLPRGTVVGFTGFMDATGEWVLVDAVDGPTGWVAARFLSNVPDSLQVPGEPPAAASSVTVENQELGDDAMVTVPRVDSEVDGWLVIHAEADGAPGPVIGYTAVSAGANENVSVEVDLEGVTPTLYAMLHQDTGEMGVYEFPDADPPVRVDDQVVVRPFTLTDMEEDGAVTFPADVVTATTLVNLNLREGPGLGFAILDTLPAGSIVGFTGFMDATGDWVQVDAADGPTGWVASQYLSNVPAGLQVVENDS